jgi:hypothetical protein
MARHQHGKKCLDDAEAERMTTVLGLPSGRLDVPRKPADVPATVAENLAPFRPTSINVAVCDACRRYLADHHDQGNVQGVDGGAIKMIDLSESQRWLNRRAAQPRCEAYWSETNESHAGSGVCPSFPKVYQSV